MSDTPAYERELDRLLAKYTLPLNLKYASTTAKMAYLIIALDNELTRVRMLLGKG